MKWFKFVALLIFSITPAVADGLAENPAFCFGYLSAQSQKESDAIKLHKGHIDSIFGKYGPKDSTDERGFSDWEKIGRDTVSKHGGQVGSQRYATFLEDCRRLLAPVGTHGMPARRVHR